MADVAGKNGTDVYAIHGAEPEVLAYAMAKYSRSSLTLRESLVEISSQKAEQFLNTFYFQYGHRSIADLAHIPMAVERLSLLAAIALVDEQRWDGQERSTRYQDFERSGWYTPEGLGEFAPAYEESVQTLFKAYRQVSEGMLEALRRAIPQPAELSEAAYTRTLKARAFDAARYLLPLATNTSLGQITNARTLETQVSRLLTSEFGEVRTLGERMRAAAIGPAWMPGRTEQAEVRSAPTLVKYAVPSLYQAEARLHASAMVRELMNGAAIAPAPVVDLVEAEPLEIEVVTSLLYPHCHYSYRQLRDALTGLDGVRRTALLRELSGLRGRHDELLRGFHAGAAFRFDILMDIGGFRDMHRHRRCTQLLQGYTELHGFEEPVCPGQPTLAEAGLDSIYREAMQAAYQAAEDLRAAGVEEAGESSQYLLPLGTRCRSMFKMDLAEAVYISELRSGPAGHFSYRRVAWEMYRAVAERHPALAEMFRVEDVNVPVDLLKR